jgi:hypothetical protein
MAKEALDPCKPTLASGAVRYARQVLAGLVGRDGLDRDVTQETAEVGQVTAVGRNGVGRCSIDLRQSGEESTDFVPEAYATLANSLIFELGNGDHWR